MTTVPYSNRNTSGTHSSSCSSSSVSSPFPLEGWFRECPPGVLLNPVFLLVTFGLFVFDPSRLRRSASGTEFLWWGFRAGDRWPPPWFVFVFEVLGGGRYGVCRHSVSNILGCVRYAGGRAERYAASPSRLYDLYFSSSLPIVGDQGLTQQYNTQWLSVVSIFQISSISAHLV